MNSISGTSYDDQKTLTGVVTANNDATNTSSLLVSGNAVITGNLKISGSLTLSALTLQNLTVTGTSNFGIVNSAGITDSVSISAPYFNATNASIVSTFNGVKVNGDLGCNVINNSSTTTPYIFSCPTTAIPSTTTAASGLQIGWNGQAGQGETDFINCAQGGNGGFAFSARNANFANKQLATLFVGGGGLRLYPNCGQLQIDDQLAGAYSLNLLQGGSLSVISSRGINTTLFIQCGNGVGTGVNVFQVSPAAINSLVPLSPQSTTTFNAFHPTTSLGNNISTNTTEYSTVGYVNSVIPTSLLGLNNTWTGSNAFNTSIPTTTLMPTTLTQFATKGYVDGAIPTSLLGLNNTWTGANTFQLPIISSGITNYSASLPIAITFPLGATPLSSTTTGDPRNGFLIGWNGLTGSNGETDFTNLNQTGNQGGFLFNNIPAGGSLQKMISILPYGTGGLRVYPYCGQLRMDDSQGGASYINLSQIGTNGQLTIAGTNTALQIGCGNVIGSNSNCLLVNATAVSPQVNFNPLSTSTFNASHPTTSLGNNISTNTSQYSTVGYVNANGGASLLPLNNTWTGNNSFYGSLRYINIGAPTNALAFGASTGNSGSIIVGDSSSLANTTTFSGNICIAPPLSSSFYTATGSNNICVGALSGTALTSGNNNLIYGASSGTGITTGSLNTVIGAGAWTTGNFSNCTVIGSGAPSPVTNNSIILGRTADTVYIKGASELNNTLMTGTTVVSNNLQVNGNITLPLTISSAGVNITYTSIPPYIIFLPTAGMSFTLPAPSAANTGQEFVIRRYGAGGGQTIIFSCVGNLAVWVPANSGPTGNTTLAVSTTWQFRFVSTGVLFLAIA
jgi:hypothetical protein